MSLVVFSNVNKIGLILDYGDSTPAILSEPAVVSDSVQVYKWVRQQTSAEIYVWGHSLGTALSTHTVKTLKMEGIIPYGLMLEAPFTTMREEITYHPIGKVYSWLPYFSATILDPLEKNGFHFRTIDNILDVDCPIMIMNAEDDAIIPYTLGAKVNPFPLVPAKVSSSIVMNVLFKLQMD